eukprot:12116350-Karenia_brevis.AAC.1
MNPRASEIQGVDTPGEGVDQQVEEKYSSEEWLQWMWSNDVGAVMNLNITCWVCGQMGHIGRNYTSKGG